MASAPQPRPCDFRLSPRVSIAALAALLVLTVVATQPVQAQTYKVLYNFTGGADGSAPSAGVTIDNDGNLYGTTQLGGTLGAGTVFELKHNGSSFVFNLLHPFAGGSDEAVPIARPIFGPDGTLYGTTAQGAGGPCDYGCGMIFDVRPPGTACKTALCPWTETVLYRFRGGNDGRAPEGNLIFDHAGNLYGTTSSGGTQNRGTVYELTPSGGGWTENVLYSFGEGMNDGSTPLSGVIFDQAGKLYGTNIFGGGSPNCPLGCGTVFQLTPSGSGWTEHVLYSFLRGSDGSSPDAGLIFDGLGNLYGATFKGGSGGGGTVFEILSSGRFSVLYSLTGYGGPLDSLVMDGSGNLYGTTHQDGSTPSGSVFKLTPSRGGWTYTSLHDFCSGSPSCSDGAYADGVTPDSDGNLYGTTEAGGAYGAGVVWEITSH